MSKLTVNFYLKKDKKRNNEVAIYSKIKFGATSTTMFTGKYIAPKRWKATNMLLKANKIPKEASLKNYIYNIPMQLDDVFLKLKKEGVNVVSALQLKNAYLGKSSQKKITLNSLVKIHNDNFKKRVSKNEVSPRSLEKYEKVGRTIKEFIKLKYSINDIPLSEINREFVYDFDSYLRYEKPHLNKYGIGNNTTVKYISNIKTIINYSKKRGVIKSNPFDVYDKKLEKVDTVFLTKTELERIEDLNFESVRLDTVRDIFMFSCYTSYAPVDSMKLRWSNIHIDDDGDEWIRTKRQKSGVDSNIEILPPVRRIINKYKNDPRCINDNRLLPNYSNQKMNEYLKEIGDLAKINKKLTWYVSRHTFATTICLGNDVPLEYVSKLMGHRTTKQTQHYAKLQDKDIKRQTTRLKKILS